ncbi:type IV secretory system conjugative DNA transfer family protein [Nocardia carnea]|uniref:type IV secretory system conjugative DNA transfer family protein n=1 Tax=Nocardia carnea TaxID=37328 RepID=UPI00245673FB|nr:TraM recognition domain-containing protein [Nocardia carnea]
MRNRVHAPAVRVSGYTALLVVACVAAVLLLVAYGAWWLASQITGTPIPGNPLLAFGYARYRDQWSPLATVFTVIAEAALLAAVVWAGRRWSQRSELEKRSVVLARPEELREIAGASAREKAQRLRPGADLSAPGGIGLTVGTTVSGGVPVTQSWEDVAIVFAGPRTGKTQGLAIGSILDAPGPVIATSNKRDLRDYTRGVCESRGRRVWESDLQGITGEPHQPWWWNPLGNIDSLKSARRLAGRFVSAERVEDAKVDSYFEGGAAELLAVYFLAAAAVEGDILHAYAWLSDEENILAADLLRSAGHPIAATKLVTAQSLHPRQRNGLYDVARRNLNVLTETSYVRSVLPPARQQIPGDTTDLNDWQPTHNLPEFDPAAFVASTDVLYALSMEGPDSASALTTALVGRIVDEAIYRARRSPGGRLPTPMVPVLDEAANVAKLSELPDWYSHIGSQGICAQVFLQSPAQAAQVWSPKQLDKLISAANIHYYGGGVKDTDYLNDLSQHIGNHDVQRWSTSHAHHGVSHSQSWSAELAMPVSVLASMPKDKAIVLSTGNRPALLRKAFWSDRPDAAEIGASYEKYGPAEETVALTKEAS